MTVPGAYSNQVEGLCGNFDGDESNDMVHSVTRQITTDVTYFAESWFSEAYAPDEYDSVYIYLLI